MKHLFLKVMLRGKRNLIERIFFVLEFFLFVFILARKQPNVSK